MTFKQKKRGWFLASLLCVGGGIVTIVLTSLNDHLLFFATPSDIQEKKFPLQKSMRLGGIVQVGSLSRSLDELELKFVLTDQRHGVLVTFKGIPPDLFREGQTIIAQGYLKKEESYSLDHLPSFTATQLLAKHDENYIPKELAKTLPSVCQTPSS